MNQQATLTEILTILQLATNAAQAVGTQIGNPDLAAGAEIAAALEAIAAKAMQAYQAHTGEPIDLTKLHQIAAQA